MKEDKNNWNSFNKIKNKEKTYIIASMKVLATDLLH